MSTSARHLLRVVIALALLSLVGSARLGLALRYDGSERRGGGEGPSGRRRYVLERKKTELAARRFQKWSEAQQKLAEWRPSTRDFVHKTVSATEAMSEVSLALDSCQLRKPLRDSGKSFFGEIAAAFDEALLLRPRARTLASVDRERVLAARVGGTEMAVFIEIWPSDVRFQASIPRQQRDNILLLSESYGVPFEPLTAGVVPDGFLMRMQFLTQRGRPIFDTSQLTPEVARRVTELIDPRRLHEKDTCSPLEAAFLGIVAGPAGRYASAIKMGIPLDPETNLFDWMVSRRFRGSILVKQLAATPVEFRGFGKADLLRWIEEGEEDASLR